MFFEDYDNSKPKQGIGARDTAGDPSQGQAIIKIYSVSHNFIPPTIVGHPVISREGTHSGE